MVELLAPAGEYNSFLGAVSAGADAVYLAGNMYGARASAVNFTEEEIIRAIRYAHLFNRKVFLTVNTLTKNDELDKLYVFLKPLYESGLDAVIVQDMGVFLYIKENFKDLDIHVSTQAVVTSKYGAKFYSDLGAKRVVLARELTLPEIKEITDTGIETECFIHGAMCYSYSGMCLFSSFLGGNSGNRGRCKGPCRQPYSIDNDKRKDAYYLSLSDMNTVDIIDKLINAGIYSFKIEGRLKSPSYAAGVTSVYRKYIDYCLENPDKDLVVTADDKALLASLYSRTSTGRGYYERVNSPKMVTIEKGAYAKVDESLEKEIIEKYIDNPLKQNVDFSFKALPGDKACLSAKTLINQVTFEANVSSEEIISEAQKTPTAKEDIFKQLNKLGNTDFRLANCDISINNSFVPSSLINKLRREVIELLENKIYSSTDSVKETLNNKDETSAYESKNNKESINENPYKRAFVKNISQLSFVCRNDFFDSVVINKELVYDAETWKIINDSDNNSKDVYIELPPVLRALNQNEFAELIRFASYRPEIKGVYANQYDAYELLKSTGFTKKICADTNIYSYNSLSASFNVSVFDDIMSSLELSYHDISGIANNKFAFLMYGRAPLMHTANCILKTSGKCMKNTGNNKELLNLKDRLGVDFKVKTLCDDNLCFNTIYNSKPTSLHKYCDRIKDKASGFLFSFTDENNKEMEKVVSFYKNVFSENKTDAPFEYTAYHMKNSIF